MQPDKGGKTGPSQGALPNLESVPHICDKFLTIQGNAMNRVIIFIFLGSLCPLAAADSSITSSVVQLGSVTDQYDNVQLDTSIDIQSHPCATSATVLSFDASTDRGKQMFSLLLAAYMADQKVLFYYSDTQCGLYGKQAQITRIYLNHGLQ